LKFGFPQSFFNRWSLAIDDAFGGKEQISQYNYDELQQQNVLTILICIRQIYSTKLQLFYAGHSASFVL